MDILAIGNRDCAVGLYWWRAAEEGDLGRPRRTAQQLAREISQMAGVDRDAYNLMVVHRPARQIGLGVYSRPVRAVALAPVLALARPDTGVLWRLRIRPDRWIVVATLKGQVPGEGDFVGDEAGAGARSKMLLEHYGNQFEERVEVDQTEHACALVQTLLEAHPLAGLPLTQPLKRPDLRRWGIALACGLAALGAGFWWLGQGRGVEAMSVQAGRYPDRSTTLPGAMQSSGPIAIRALGPNGVLDTCSRFWRRLPLSEEGWMLVRFRCDGHQVSLSWRYRPGASFVHLPPGAVWPVGLGAGVPEEAVATESIHAHAKIRLVTEDLRSRIHTEMLFYRMARLEGIRSVLFSWSPFEQPARISSGRADARPVPWVGARWVLGMHGVIPRSLGPALARLPGVEVHQVVATITAHRLRWVVKGVVYARA